VEKAEGIAFEGLLLPQCGVPAGLLTSAQQNCLESSAGGDSRSRAMLHHCKTVSPPPLSAAHLGSQLCIRNEERAVCFSDCFSFFSLLWLIS